MIPVVANGVYSYNVKVLNSCATPGPNISAASNTAASCVGGALTATMDVTPTTIIQGDSYTVTILDCLAAANPTIQTLNDDPLTFASLDNDSNWPETFSPIVTETGATTGTFNITIGTTGDVAESGKLHVLSSDTITVDYPSASLSETVTVIPDPCDSTPSAPTGLSGSVTGQNIDLDWDAVTDSDLAGYRIYERVCAKDKSNCTGGDIVAEWFLRNSVGSATTSITLSSDHGNVSQRIYYFKVTAIDTCGTPNESTDSNVWNE